MHLFCLVHSSFIAFTGKSKSGKHLGTFRPTSYPFLLSTSSIVLLLPFLHGSQVEMVGVGGMAMNVRVFAKCSFYLAHGPYIGIFAASNSDIIQLQSVLPFGVPQLLLADATATKVGPASFEVVVITFNSSSQTIFQSRTAYPKVARMLKAIKNAGYGPNLANSEHDEWRKHRRIAGPSFTESNNVLVWESSVEIILGYFIKWNRDGKGSTVKVSNFIDVTTQIAFMVFATAGV